MQIKMNNECERNNLTSITKTVFISYSWDNEIHKAWVKQLSDELSMHGVKTILDQKDLQLGDYLTSFMERSIIDSDYTLIICTPNYKEKADNRIGGVGYEESIISTDVLFSNNNRKYIPVLASGKWENAVPNWAKGKLGVDLSSKSKYDQGLKRLLNTIHNQSSIKEPAKEANLSQNGSAYEYLYDYFIHSPASLQISLLENISNICSTIDCMESYEVIEDFSLFLDKISEKIVENGRLKDVYEKVKLEVEHMLYEEIRDLWNDR